MGLYESELSRQIHLRSRQKKEWHALRKKMEEAAALASNSDDVEKQLLEDKRKEDSREMQETAASKQLAAAMVNSSTESKDETLHKCVDLLNNQNDKFFIFIQKNIEFIYVTIINTIITNLTKIVIMVFIIIYYLIEPIFLSSQAILSP